MSLSQPRAADMVVKLFLGTLNNPTIARFA